MKSKHMNSTLKSALLGLTVAWAALATPSVQAQGLSCQTVPLLFSTYLEQHVTHKNLTPDIRKKAVEQYIKALDPAKSILLTPDLKTIETHINGVFFSMRSGKCEGLNQANELYLKRIREIEVLAKDILSDKFKKVDENVTLILDPDKRTFPATEEARKELLTASLNFQVWNLLDSGTKLPEAKKKIIHRYELLKKRSEEKKTENLYVDFIDAFANALDPHTAYFSRDRLADFRIDMSLSLEGIGASLSSEDGYTIVEEIIPGGAADRAGVLRAKDKIVSVAQDKKEFQSVIDMDLKEVVKLIRGKKGSTVRLSLLRKSGEVTTKVEVAIVRDKVNLKDQAAKIRFEDKTVSGSKFKFAIIDLPSFYGDPEKAKKTAYDDVKVLIQQAKAQKADGLVLNLERNGGGLLHDAVRISGLFIDEGAIVATQSSNGKMDILRDRDPSSAWTGPLVVLTSRASASASEILAGALKDYRRAVIVGGDHTFGKGSVQAIMDLNEQLGAIKITTGMFYLPGGFSTQYRGVEADVVLPSTLNTDEVGERRLDNALEPRQVAPFLSAAARDAKNPNTWTPVESATLAELKKSSQARVSSNEDFKKILQDIEEAKKNKGAMKLADLIKKSSDPEAKKKTKRDEKKSRQQLLDEYQRPYINEALNILADLTVKQRGLDVKPRLFVGEKTSQGSAGKVVE